MMVMVILPQYHF